MKNSVYILFLLFTIIGCKYSKNKYVGNENILKTELNSFLDDWHLAATKANFNNYFSKMDSVSVFIGTDATENWGKAEFEAFCKPYFNAGKAWDFKALERNIFINDDLNFAWFDELLNTWMGTCRGSGVLEKKDNGWKIKHYVLSVSIPNNDIKNIIDIKKREDSIFLTKFN